MRSALYYPHTTIRNESILKTALLLWDQLEYITPSPSFRPKYPDELWEKAMEVIGRPHCPSDEEKQMTHKAVEAWVNDSHARGSIPDWFYAGDDEETYLIWPDKLLSQTWKLLENSGLVLDRMIDGDAATSYPFGLILMGILADVCAGETRSRLTDEELSYAYLTRWLTYQHDGKYISQEETGQYEGDLARYERLATITLKVVDANALSLQRLVDFRSSEDADRRELRHRYLQRLEEQVEKIRKTKITLIADRNELERQFEQDMEDDHEQLKEALKMSKKEVLSSKEMGVAIVTGAGTLASLFSHTSPEGLTAGAGLIALGGIYGVWNKLTGGRKSALKNHPMAYLHQLKGH